MKPQTPITPNDISINQHFWDAFGNNETEVSAHWIVRFCQERGTGWEPFTYDEINSFYQANCKAKHPGNFTFNRLIPGVHKHMTAQSFPYGETRDNNAVITVDSGGHYHITAKFVAACYKSSPVES